MPPGRKAPPKKKSKREQILDVAGNLFINHGFNAVSVDQIAAAVPVSKPTLYAHFKDKRGLFTAVISGRCQVFVAALRAGLEGGKTPEEALYRFTREFLDMMLRPESLRLKRMIIGESVAFPELAKLFYESGPKPVHALLAGYLKNLHKQKILALPDPDLAADMLVSMVKGSLDIKCLLGMAQPKTISARKREYIARSVVTLFIKAHAH